MNFVEKIKEKPKKLPKILIAIPTYEGKNYCLDAFLDNVKNFSYPKSRLDFYVADNSATNENARMLNKKYGLKVFWKDYTGYTVFDKMADSHNQLRRYFLESDCDYMLHLESDVFPQTDVIERLLEARKPIVNALYQILDGANRTPCLAQVDKNHEYWRSFRFHAKSSLFWHSYCNGKLQPTYIAGIGCCLMKKKVMKNFEFRHPENGNNPPDTYFAEDLLTRGVQNWVHTGVHAFHWNKEDWGRHFKYMKYHKSE
jgi:GT2 family glycosyltransferase